MKKVLLLFLLFASVTSCKKDNNTDAGIVGKWKVVKDEIVIVRDGQQIDTETEYYQDTDYIEIFSDNTMKFFIDGDTDSGKWRLEDNGKRFVMIETGSNDEYPYEIKVLNKSTLVLYEEYMIYQNTYKVTSTFNR